MRRRALARILRALLGLLLLVGCGPTAAKKSTVDRSSGADVKAGTPAPSGKTDPKTGQPEPTPSPGAGPLPSQQIGKSLDFFTNKVLPLVKQAPCINCHADPRQVTVQNGGLKPQNHTEMFALLKDGKAANDNKLFNMMRGTVPHPGSAQCVSDTAAFCAVLQDWYKTVFGDGALSLGRIDGVSKQGTINGWAGNSGAATTILAVRFYLDADNKTGSKFADVMANLSGRDNDIEGDHAFSVPIPEVMIDNKAHKLYGYVVNNGVEVPLSGSPFSYAAYKPKGAAVGTQYANAGFGCQGTCHQFNYNNRWAVMLGDGTGGWSSTNNSLYNKLISGQHGGPALCANAQAAMCVAVKTWFTQEFPEVAP